MELARHKRTYFWCWAGCSGETRGGLGTRRFWRSSTEGGCITWEHLNTTRDDGIWNLKKKRARINSKKYTVFKTYSKPYIKNIGLPHSSICIPPHMQCWQWLMACSHNFSNKYPANIQNHILTEVAQNTQFVLKNLWIWHTMTENNKKVTFFLLSLCFKPNYDQQLFLMWHEGRQTSHSLTRWQYSEEKTIY